jgi:hypothetical protein
MSKQRHDPHSGHDHIEGQQGQKSNAEIARQRAKAEEEMPSAPEPEKGEDGRPHKPPKKEHG